MLEWDEKKRLKTRRERHLDFRDAYQVFDGRQVIHARAWRNQEERFVSTAEISGKFYAVEWLGARQQPTDYVIQESTQWRGKSIS